jgi:hypothetical protein
LGRVSSEGSIQEITLGTNLSFDGTTLNAAGAGATSFADVTAGTNTAALVVGTGGSLSTSGTGSITATALTCTGCIGDTQLEYDTGQNLTTSSTPAFSALTLSNTTNQIVLGTTNTTTITSVAPASSRTATIPALSANDEFLFAAQTQTLTGKTIAAGSNTISGLTTTNFTSANVSQWTNDAGYLTSVSGQSIGDLSDVVITTASDGQLLRYVSSQSRWENFTPSYITGVVWGDITGTLSNQTDLQTALGTKQDTGNYITALTGDVTAAGPGSATATIANQAVTYAKIQNVTGDRLLGRVSSEGSIQEITLGTNLSFDGTTLNAAGAGATSFADVTAGTNTAALVVGTGGSLSTSGTGSITATALTCTGCIGDTQLEYDTGQNLTTSSTPAFSALTLSNTTNQIVLGTTNTTTISSSAPAAGRTATIPALSANDEFLFAAQTQTLTGKTIAAGSNTISGLTTTNFTSANVSQWTNDAGYLTSVSGQSIGDLSDVVITTASDGQLLRYVSSQSRWENFTPSYITGVVWGDITGTLSNQTDLQTALGTKQDTGNYITALTGDVTAAGPGSATATIANQAVTYAKIQNVTGDRLLGRVSSEGSIQEITLGTNLSFDGTTLNAGGGVTLQGAYDETSGNTITTTDAKNIIFTLAEVTTPTSFQIFNQDTAGVTALEIDNTISSGTLTRGLLIEQSGTGTMTSAIEILETAGTITTGITIGNNIGTGISLGTGLTTGISVGSGGISIASGGLTITSGALAVNSDSITSDGELVIEGTNSVVLGNTTNGFRVNETFGSTSGWLGNARPAKKITLTPEYPGAVLSAFNGSATDTNTTGTMTSDTETSPSSSIKNYYNWVRTQNTLHYQTVVVRFTLPQDFSAWTDPGSDSAFEVDYLTNSSNSANNLLDVRIYLEGDGTAENSSTGNTTTNNTTWQEVTFAASTFDKCDTAGEVCVIYLRMGSLSSNWVRIGDIRLNYLSRF